MFLCPRRQVIYILSLTILGDDNSNSITGGLFIGNKYIFRDLKDYQKQGGMKGMGESLNRLHVMIFSLWDDVEFNML